MQDETKHGAPIPPGDNPAGPGPQYTCSEFEALLMDAMEGTLSEASKTGFDAHRRVCAVCGPLLADVEAGQQWLRSLEPVEPPAYLVHNILAATSGVMSTRMATTSAGGTRTPLGERVREWWDSWFAPATAFVRQPRFVMSFGMIFFTFSLMVSAAGVKASDVAKIDVRPSALRHAYNDAQIKVVQYYDNIRFVYEIESKVRELRRAATPAEPGPEPKKENRTNDNTSGQPDQKQDRNYSREENQIVLAGLTGPSDVVSLTRAASREYRASSKPVLARSSQPEARSRFAVTTNRRFV
ncbi:MAG: hypothetical protein WCC04_04755 [Terriglobales bacterium]